MAEYVHDIKETIARVADERMRRIEMSLAIQERLSHETVRNGRTERPHAFLAISCECGAGGSEISQLVADRLGWRHLDRELLDCVALMTHVHPEALEYVDEKGTSWLADMFSQLFDRRAITQMEYVNRMTSVLLTSLRHRNLVVVGRGAQFILPRNQGASVRIVAPLKQRIARVQTQRKLTHRAAAHYIADIDRNRRAFVDRYFHHDVRDPHLFDWVINMAHLTTDEAADALVGLCHQHFVSAA